jgi:ribosomal protein S4
LIVHGHISVNGRKQTSPSYLVKVSEENSIDFSGVSPFQDEDHPERTKMIQGGKAPAPVSKKEGAEGSEEKKSDEKPKSEKKQEAKENKPEKENKESSEKSDETDKKSKSNEKEGNSDEKSKEEKGDEE